MDNRTSDFSQEEFGIRFEWGLAGLQALQETSDVIIIVDVLSFSTCVDIVVARSGVIFPYSGTREALADFASAHDASTARYGREQGSGYSLSPVSLSTAPLGSRLVLPSPNGSTLSLATKGMPTLTGCLRNAAAIAAKAEGLGERISVIAAGERWPDGRLRPALEDLLGAGAIINLLPDNRSPEANLALCGFLQVQSDLHTTLQRCGSGKELVRRGFATDLHMASQLNVSHAAPYLIEQAYR